MRNDDVPLDLRRLRQSLPPDSPANEDAFVNAVMEEIRQRGTTVRVADPLVGLRDLALPFLAAASLLVAAAIAWHERVETGEHRPRSVAEALGVPPEFLDDAARRRGGE